jgi:hypothetical protein
MISMSARRIQLTARYLSKADAATDVATAAARLLKSSASLKVLLDDLLDFNRTKLGLGITISPAPVDLAEALWAWLVYRPRNCDCTQWGYFGQIGRK